METPKEYYYTYYSYEEWGRGYFGSRKCYCLPEEDITYLGSSKDKTFKPKYKIILKDDYATREEAYADEIILQEHYKVVENPHFANRCYQTTTKFYIPKEKASEIGKKLYEEGKGLFSLTQEEKSELGRKLGTRMYEEKRGIFSLTYEEKYEIGRKNYENGVGIFNRTDEEILKDTRKGGKKLYEESKGIFSITPEERKEINKKTNSQKWMCLETGFITGAAPLSNYQKARGIDTSKRVRVS